MNNIEQTLHERDNRYGEFMLHAEITQSLKKIISHELEKRSKLLEVDQQEALDMIAL